jgi:cytochrome c556
MDRLESVKDDFRISRRRGDEMEQSEIQDKIYEYMQQMKGKKKLKEKDIIKKITADTGEEKDTVKKALRAMIDVGKLMYSYGGGASSVEIPSEEYLKEKGLI